MMLIQSRFLSPVLECTCGYGTGTIAILTSITLVLILGIHYYQHLVTLFPNELRN